MNYEGMTFEKILRRALEKVSDSIDKRQGSMVYDSVAPAAAELAMAYIEMNSIYGKLNAENLDGNQLELFVKQKAGIDRKRATKAIRKGVFSKADGSFLNVPLGSRFTGEGSYFRVRDKVGDGKFELECEEAGEVGNNYMGTLIPVDYLNGLAKAELTHILIPGYDAEGDESLLERYYERIRTPTTSGNKYHYLNWAKEVTGVGDAKVMPLWNGNGTVKIVVVDSNKGPATIQLTEKVQDYIEEVRPIGATVTVVSASAKTISVKARVSLADGYLIQLVQDEFKNGLDEYRKDVGFKDSYISYAAINNILFNVDGVVDSADLTLNNEMKNIALGGEEIPIFDLVELEVM